MTQSLETREYTQKEQAEPRMRKNTAGGFTFTLSPRDQVRRFLILGMDAPTYYQDKKQVAKLNSDLVVKMAEIDHETLLKEILDVSLNGLAPRQQATLYAYAIACSVGDPFDADVAAKQRRAALDQFNKVIRTGTQLFTFLGYVEQFRGWGRQLRRAVAGWYTANPAERVAYQAIKYKQRGGWSQRDALRLSHAASDDLDTKGVLDYIAHGESELNVPILLRGPKLAEAGKAEWMDLIKQGLPWEAWPDELKTIPSTWEAAIDAGLPMTAMIRQLSRLTKLGVIQSRKADIMSQLQNPEHIKRARVHPVTILIAANVYAAGHSVDGRSHWTPDRDTVDALNEAFYMSFGNVTPSNARIMYNLDVSGSMQARVADTFLSAREATSAMAAITLATEPNASIWGFTSGKRHDGWRGYNTSEPFTDLSVLKGKRIDAICKYTKGLDFGRTDCALPMEEALRRGLEVDLFVIGTDSETYAGRVHPFRALERYREKTGIPAKLAVLGTAATDFTIAKPSDPGMIDIVGFDANVPGLLREFALR